MNLLTTDDLNNFKKALGLELRNVRKNVRRWPRRTLRDEMLRHGGDEEISIQSLGTYELGTRTLTVTRLLQIAAVLGVHADDMFSQAYKRAFPNRDLDDAELITVNLYLLTQAKDARLQPLVAWAQARFNQADRNPLAVVTLDRTGIQAFVNQTGVAEDRLLDLLSKIGALKLAALAA